MSDRREVERLVDAARHGDTEAFGLLFDRFYRPIYRYAYARLGVVGDAEDAAAETFVSALAAIPRFAWREAPFEAWLFRIAASKVGDVRRRRVRDVAGLPPTLPQGATAEGDPAVRLLDRERSRHLLDAVEGLPPAQRDVILLRFVAQLPVAEVARILGCTEGAVKQLRFRALARLRMTLQD